LETLLAHVFYLDDPPFGYKKISLFYILSWGKRLSVDQLAAIVLNLYGYFLLISHRLSMIGLSFPIYTGGVVPSSHFHAGSEQVGRV